MDIQTAETTEVAPAPILTRAQRNAPARLMEEAKRGTRPDAREVFVTRKLDADAGIRATKLTKPQRRALDALHAGAPVAPGSVVSLPMLGKLVTAGLATLAGKLTPQGMAHARRADALAN